MLQHGNSLAYAQMDSNKIIHAPIQIEQPSCLLENSNASEASTTGEYGWKLSGTPGFRGETFGTWSGVSTTVGVTPTVDTVVFLANEAGIYDISAVIPLTIGGTFASGESISFSIETPDITWTSTCFECALATDYVYPISTTIELYDAGDTLTFNWGHDSTLGTVRWGAQNAHVQIIKRAAVGELL